MIYRFHGDQPLIPDLGRRQFALGNQRANGVRHDGETPCGLYDRQVARGRRWNIIKHGAATLFVIIQEVKGRGRRVTWSSATRASTAHTPNSDSVVTHQHEKSSCCRTHPPLITPKVWRGNGPPSGPSRPLTASSWSAIRPT